MRVSMEWEPWRGEGISQEMPETRRQGEEHHRHRALCPRKIPPRQFISEATRWGRAQQVGEISLAYLVQWCSRYHRKWWEFDAAKGQTETMCQPLKFSKNTVLCVTCCKTPDKCGGPQNSEETGGKPAPWAQSEKLSKMSHFLFLFYAGLVIFKTTSSCESQGRQWTSLD